ncbi:MAG: sensor histidine kinase, partial [Bryobacteraceae bacterium]
PFLGDVIYFLHTVPLLGALALRPHTPQATENLRVGHVDLALLLTWWVYLYLFVVIPWQYITPNEQLYGRSYDQLYAAQNLIFAGGLLYLVFRTTGPWRRVYLHLFGAGVTYSLSSFVINAAIESGSYHTGGLYDVGLMAAFVWFGTAGIVAHRICPPAETQHRDAALAFPAMPSGGLWPKRLAMSAALSLPAMGLWSELSSGVDSEVKRFRLLVTLAAMVLLTWLVFLRQDLVDRERLRLLRASHETLQNLRRIQTQFVHSEKLASLGQLAAGAAHEINNPLTAILGFSDVLLCDNTAPEQTRRIAEKIREQARRTKMLVGKLLNFAQPPPAERTLVEINGVLSSAIELRRLDLRDKKIQIEFAQEGAPVVQGDANQLMQVFLNLINNAVDAMEETRGGRLHVRSIQEAGNVRIDFQDCGPGIAEPSLVFDPFYTTKP